MGVCYPIKSSSARISNVCNHITVITIFCLSTMHSYVCNSEPVTFEKCLTHHESVYKCNVYKPGYVVSRVCVLFVMLQHLANIMCFPT